MRDFMNNRIILEDMENIANRQSDLRELYGTTVLVTGAYGMLASYIVFFLIYLNETQTEGTITILAQGRKKEKMRQKFGIYTQRSYFKYIDKNINEPIYMSENIDYIIHAASLASPQYYGTNPVGTLLPNVLGTYYLLELARSQRSFKGFLFFSSGDVYGYLPPEGNEYCETDFGYVDCMDIRSCYGESKRMGETLCKAFWSQHDIPVYVVRIAHTYGPTLDLCNDKRVFAEFVKNVVNNENIVMKSDGSAERMFCYIIDAVDAFIKIILFGKSGEAYNMYNNTQICSIKNLAEKLVVMYPEKKLQVITQNRDSQYLESPVHKSPVMRVDKLKCLGWRPKISVEEGFKRTIDSFLLGDV